MTLPPERIGDRGQRFVAQCKGWPKQGGGWQNCVYSDTRDGADRACEALALNPSVRETRTLDRLNPY